jgi:hypothetical protein
MAESKPPVSKKIGPRRVRTEAVAGQRDEPVTPRDKKTLPSNDDRLKADKPPLYEVVVLLSDFFAAGLAGAGVEAAGVLEADVALELDVDFDAFFEPDASARESVR